MTQQNWPAMVLMVAGLALSGCGVTPAPAGQGAADGAVSDTYPELCQYPLTSLKQFLPTLTVDEATAAAQKHCQMQTDKDVFRATCADGRTVVTWSGGYGGDTWWFDATGKLVGYRYVTDWAHDGICINNVWGEMFACDGAIVTSAICPTPTDASDTSDTEPDAVDEGSDAAPDSLDVAADIPAENTVCASQADCAADKWCNYTGCGFTMGQCVGKPTDCAGQFAPVCGCDTHSYDSACHAQKAGKSIAAYAAPCLGIGCAPACASGYTCVDCASAGVQCLTPGQQCVGGK